MLNHEGSFFSIDTWAISWHANRHGNNDEWKIIAKRDWPIKGNMQIKTRQYVYKCALVVWVVYFSRMTFRIMLCLFTIFITITARTGLNVYNNTSMPSVEIILE